VHVDQGSLLQSTLTALLIPSWQEKRAVRAQVFRRKGKRRKAIPDGIYGWGLWFFVFLIRRKRALPWKYEIVRPSSILIPWPGGSRETIRFAIRSRLTTYPELLLVFSVLAGIA